MSHVEGVLITAAARLGRLRPTHGELWLLDDGLLYRTLDLRRTAAQLRTERGQRAPAQTVDPDDRPRDRFAVADLERITDAAGTNRWVARDEVRTAWLRRALTVTRLRLAVDGDEQVAFSWPRRDQATPAVEARLREWLGEQLRVAGSRRE